MRKQTVGDGCDTTTALTTAQIKYSQHMKRAEHINRGIHIESRISTQNELTCHHSPGERFGTNSLDSIKIQREGPTLEAQG